MKNKFWSDNIVIVTVLIALFLFIGSRVVLIAIQGLDYEIELDDGYGIVMLSGGEYVLVNQYVKIVIYPTVDGYREVDKYIIGHVAPIEWGPEGNPESFQEGYFILEKFEDVVIKELSKDEWIEELRRRGIADKAPSLKRPTRLNKLISDIF